MLQLNVPYIVTMTDFYLICHHAVLLTTEGKLCYGPNLGKNCMKFCPEFAQDELAKRYQIGRQILFGAKKVIAPSDFLARQFTKEFVGLNVDVINYGVDNTSLKTNNKTYT